MTTLSTPRRTMIAAELLADGAAPETTEPRDDTTTRALRAALVHQLVAAGDLVTPSVVEAFRAVPRHLFCPDAPLGRAYADHALPIGYDQTISQPAVVAAMTEALELGGHERVLEIGTGSGYQAAVLAMLAREVYTVERVAPLASLAEKRLAELGFANVHVRFGDGFAGWPEHAPYDRILLTAAPEELPPALLDQLAEGGVVVAPLGPQALTGQALVRMRKVGGALRTEDLGGVFFVEMRRGTEAAP